MRIHDFLLVAVAFFSECIGTLSGFGSSTFFVPTAVYLEAFKFVLALTAILHCFGNISKIFLFRKNIPRDLIIRLGLPSIIFAGIGALLNGRFSGSLLTQLLGCTLVLISLLTLLKNHRLIRISPNNASLACGISGFMTGLVGTGGAIRGMTLNFLQIEKNSFVALSAGIDIGGDLLRAGIYVYQGYMDWNQWFYIPALGIAAISGAFVGKRILGYIHQNQFERVVTILVLISGIAMIFD